MPRFGRLMKRTLALAIFVDFSFGARLKGDNDFPLALRPFFRDSEAFVFVGAGSFAKVWLTNVTVGSQMEERAVKVLHHMGQYVTAAYMQTSYDQAKIQLNVEDARRECSALQDMHNLRGGTMDAAGSEHILQCHRSNIEEAWGDPTSQVPLFLELSSAGREDLKSFMTRHVRNESMNTHLVMRVYAQILKAFDFLSHHPSKWIHHDFKRDHFMFKAKEPAQASTDDFQLTLIDFGGAVKGVPENACAKSATVSPMWFPRELRQGDGETGCPRGQVHVFATCSTMANDLCPQSYDMFASTLVLLELITLAPFTSLFQGQWHVPNGPGGKAVWKYDALDTFVGRSDFIDVIRERAHPLAPIKGHDFKRYEVLVKKAALCLHSEAVMRPSARALLSDLGDLHKEDDAERDPHWARQII